MFEWSIFWYGILTIAWIAFSLLDGFDLGVGMIHLTGKGDGDRRAHLAAIGPVWDGNAVWLIIVSGALFASFPNAFATLFSSFYDLVMLLLVGIIIRPVAIEFRNKRPSKLWRGFWDLSFCKASFLITCGLGLILGNVVRGIRLNEQGEYVGEFTDFLNPYAWGMALTLIAFFSLHGALFLFVKSEGQWRNRLRPLLLRLSILAIVTHLGLILLTFLDAPHLITCFWQRPLSLILLCGSWLTLLNLARQVAREKDKRAFVSSSLSLTLWILSFAWALFPTLIRSTLSPEKNSLLAMDSLSPHYSLVTLSIVVLISLPIVIFYTVWIYRIFRGKLSSDQQY